MGYSLESAHEAKDPHRAIEHTDSIFVGGGNAFRLLKELEDLEVIELIRRKVNSGAPYIGSSAGSNVAGPTIKTTKDMPIVQPRSFDSLSLVPFQILGKLRESHSLFLGYAVRDWTLRVFLKRVWEGRFGAKSWAIAPDPDLLEKETWAQSNVELYASDLGDYVDLLRGRLAEAAPQ